MSRLNILLTGYSIADEIINRTSSASLKIGHDLIRYVLADFEIWTGASKTGTKLALTSDFTLSGEDTAYSTLAGVPIYTKLAIVNGAYHSTNLYITYKTIGDYTSVENVSEIALASIAQVGFTADTAPLDADEVLGFNSTDSLFNKIRTTWTNVKAFLKTYFDTLYWGSHNDGNGGQPPAPKPNSTAGTVGFFAPIAGVPGASVSTPNVGSQYATFLIAFVAATGVPYGYDIGYWSCGITAANTIITGVAGVKLVLISWRIA